MCSAVSRMCWEGWDIKSWGALVRLQSTGLTISNTAERKLCIIAQVDADDSCSLQSALKSLTLSNVPNVDDLGRFKVDPRSIQVLELSCGTLGHDEVQTSIDCTYGNLTVCRATIPTASIYLLCHAFQLAAYISDLIAGAIVPPRMPQAMFAATSPYGQIVNGLHIHPDNMTNFDDYQSQAF